MFQQRFRLDINAGEDKVYHLDCPNGVTFIEVLEVAKYIYKLAHDKIVEAEAKAEVKPEVEEKEEQPEGNDE